MSDELKPCPNRECEGGKVMSMWFKDSQVFEAQFFCGACGTRGPRARNQSFRGTLKEARDAWNALPRDEPADSGGDEAMRLLRRIAAGDPAASNGGEYCEYCDVLANQGRINHHDDCVWAVAKRRVEAGS